MSVDINQHPDLHLEGHPFLASTFNGRAIIARWGPAMLHVGSGSTHIDWALLARKGAGEPWRMLVWSERSHELKAGFVASIQSNKDGVFVGRHPHGVPLVVIEDWTYEDGASGVEWF